MMYEVRCYGAPYENTSMSDLDRAYDLCLSLSEEYGLTEVVEWFGPHQQVIASYTYGA